MCHCRARHVYAYVCSLTSVCVYSPTVNIDVKTSWAERRRLRAMRCRIWMKIDIPLWMIYFYNDMTESRSTFENNGILIEPQNAHKTKINFFSFNTHLNRIVLNYKRCKQFLWCVVHSQWKEKNHRQNVWTWVINIKPSDNDQCYKPQRL